MPDIDPQVISHYETHDQAQRLLIPAAGKLEMARTRELLRRFLPPAPARILDVGGGPGAHARWLINDGYTVHLIDPIPKHLDQARAYAGCTTELADARSLPTEDHTYDAALLLGPLYHLPDRADRITALREARRTVRPSGLIAAAAISRTALLMDYSTVSSLTNPEINERLGIRLRTGYLPTPDDDPTGLFTATYFHTSNELRSEMAEAGFGDLAIHGIEGPAWSMLKGIERHTGHPLNDDTLLTAAMEAARQADEGDVLPDTSAHMIALAYD